MALFLPRRWRRKPTHPVALEPNNNFVRNLASVFCPGIDFRDVKTGKPLTNQGATYSIGIHGPQYTIASASTQRIDAVSPGFSLNTGDYISVFALVRSITASNNAVIMAVNYDGNTVPIMLCAGGSPGAAYDGMAAFDGSWRKSGISTNIRGDNKWHAIGGIRFQQNYYYYVDGKQDVYSSSPGTSGSVNTNAISYGSYIGDTVSFGGDIALGIVWKDRNIGDDGQSFLAQNPWQIFSPQRNVAYFLGTAGGAGPYTITAAQGSYTFTGNAATLTKQSKLTADQQSYTLTGNATNLLKTFILTATQQTFTLSGIDAGLFHGQALITSTGSFTLSGNDVIFNRGVMLPASSGSFTLTGNAASLLKTYVLALSSGTFTFTGNDATLTHSLATNKTLIADVGTFTLTGNDVTFPYNQVLAAGTGSFTETGNDANLLVGKKLSTTTGNFIFTGNDTGLAQSYIFSVDKGTFVLTGRNVNLWYPTAPAGTPLEILKLSTAQYMGVSEPNISVVDAGGGTYTVTVNSGESMSKIDSVHYEGYKVNSGTELGS